MAVELKLLGVAVIIGLVTLLWSTVAARRVQDLKWAAGPRDEPMPTPGAAGRLNRAYANFMETFPLHAVAVVTAYLAGKLGDLTLWGSVAYVIGRALHPVFYVFAVPLVRTLVWFVAFAGTLAVVAAIFL